MTAPLILACLWALAATGVAFLPMRRQMVPGLALLLVAPVLIVWIGVAVGWGWAVAGLAAFLSMFRNPLIYFARRALGQPVHDPRRDGA